jgi:hypothetical protein
LLAVALSATPPFGWNPQTSVNCQSVPPSLPGCAKPVLLWTAWQGPHPMSANELATRYFSGVMAVIGYAIAVLVVVLNLLVLCGFAMLILHMAFGIDLVNPLDWFPAEWRQRLLFH